jgi:hypothetical protein
VGRDLRRSPGESAGEAGMEVGMCMMAVAILGEGDVQPRASPKCLKCSLLLQSKIIFVLASRIIIILLRKR